MTWADAIVATVREPLVLLDEETRVILASASFYRSFRVVPEETMGRPLAALGNGQWNIPAPRPGVEVMKTLGRYWFQIVELPEPVTPRFRQ